MRNLNTYLLIRKLNAALLLIAFTAFSIASINAQTYIGGSATISATGSPTALPYPLTVEVDAVGAIASVTATVTITHTWPDDLEILLVSPTGAMCLLMSDAGGSGDVTALTVTFDQTAGSTIPDAGPLGAGPYKPTDISSGDILEAPAPAGPYSANLDNFIGIDPNGTWSLYIDDDASGDGGSIGGWSITINLATPCTDPPTAGTTVLSPSAACEGSGFTASLAGGTSGDGQTYQWQSSPDGSDWSNIDGATSSTYAGTAATAAYYRCLVTCGESTDDSDPAFLSVSETPTGNTSTDPIAISSLPYESSGDNFSANCWTSSTGNTSPDVWYSYTADCDGAIDVYVCASWDSYLRIYDVTGTQLAFDDDTEPVGCGSLSSSLSNFAVTSGTTYFIIVEGFSANEGEYSLSVNPISISPAGDITVCYGTITTISATAGYDTYQWYKNGIALSGATSATLNTKKPGFYQVEASNGGCSVMSEIQAIAVIPSPAINIKAAGGNTDLCLGLVGLKIISASYDGSVQWYLNGIAIDGATSSTYLPIEAGDYSCVASNLNGCTTESEIISVSSSCRLGEEVQNIDLIIYPNPAQSELFVSATFGNSLYSNAEINLYNSLGQLVYTTTISMNNGEVRELIGLGDLTSGIYTISVRSNGESQTSQLVIN